MQKQARTARISDALDVESSVSDFVCFYLPVRALNCVGSVSFGTGTARRVAGVCLPLTEKFDPLGLGNTDIRQQRLRSERIWTEID